jgi:hypothetical protein
MDLDAAHRGTLLPSYIGTETPYVGEPNGPETKAELELTIDRIDSAGTDRRAVEREMAELGIDTLPGYEEPMGDVVAAYIVAHAMDCAKSLGGGVASEIIYDQRKKDSIEAKRR